MTRIFYKINAMKLTFLISICFALIALSLIVLNLAIPAGTVILIILEILIVVLGFALINAFITKNIKNKFSKIVQSINNVQKNVVNPSIITDKNKIIISANKAFLDIGEYEEKDLIGKRLGDIYSYPMLKTKSREKILLESQLWPIEFGDMKIFLLLTTKEADNIGLEKILEYYKIGVIECDENGFIRSAIGCLIDLLGLAKVYGENKELVGKKIYEMAQFNNLNSSTIKEGKISTLETEAKTIQGNLKTYSVFIIKVEDNKFYITFKDITKVKLDQREVEARNLRYKAIVNIAPIGIMVIDDDMKIKEFNSYFALMLGTSNTEAFIDRKVTDISGLSETGMIANIRKSLRIGTPSSEHVKFLSQYGKTSSFTYITTPIRDNDLITGVFVLIEESNIQK